MEMVAEQEVHEAAKRRQSEGPGQEEEGEMVGEVSGDSRLVLKIKGGHRMHTVIEKVLEALEKRGEVELAGQVGGGGLDKVVSIAEIVKRKSPSIQQKTFFSDFDVQLTRWRDVCQDFGSKRFPFPRRSEKLHHIPLLCCWYPLETPRPGRHCSYAAQKTAAPVGRGKQSNENVGKKKTSWKGEGGPGNAGIRDNGERLQRKLLLQDARIEQLHRRHRAEIQAYEQKIETLEYVHKNLKKQIQTKGEEEILKEDLAAEAVLAEQYRSQVNLEAATAKQQKANEQEVVALENAFDQHLDKLREQFVKSFEELKTKYEQQYEQARQTLELREKVEVHEVEERKNLHINELMASHRSAFEQIKAYQGTSEGDRRNAGPSENRPQANAGDAVGESATDRASPTAASAQLEEKVKAAKQSNHQMEQQKHKLERDIGEYTRRLRNLQNDAHMRTQAKIMLYEQKVSQMLKSLEQKFRQREELITSLGLRPEVAIHLEEILRQSFCEKNDEIDHLRAELQKMAKSYNDTVLTMKARLKQLGVNSDCFDFELIQDTEYISKAPAPCITTTVPVARGNCVLSI
ncbi:growth arrest-specific protein 8 [Cystoisospora suis]|uniref:Growth arrest-specific protein 8 n=1 Tax=Cystoisospora suis TaxID=483139 RepID=A0A2C6KTB9_9APIC|nr:growth arrest-specific protein 8 [Cystoisospora suis]